MFKPLFSFPRSYGRRARARAGFSLVEVTLALGIMAFCMVAIFGLLPVAINTQQSSQDAARASTALNMVSTAARSVQRDPTAAGKYNFPQFFSDNADSQGNPTTFTVGNSPWTYTYFVLEDGSIRKTGDTTPPRQTLYVQVTPPMTKAEPLRIYAAVAWPWRPTDKSSLALTDLKGRQGLVDSYIVYALRD